MAAERSWTILDLLSEATAFLGARGIESPRVNAEVLLGHALSLRRVELYARFDRPVDPRELTSFRELVRRRLTRVPLQYLTGAVEFFSRAFAIRDGVFIPRPETEVLVEKALEPLRGPRGLAAGAAAARVAEIGVGSGAVLVTVLLELPDATGVGTDVSAAALSLARENADRHGLGDRVELLEGSLLEPLEAPGGAAFDLIIANPPYLSDAMLAALAPEVRDHEPRAALVSGPDGLEALRPLIASAWRLMRSGGVLALEIGETQGGDALALVRASTTDAGAAAYDDAALHRDYAGKDRVIVARRRGD